LSTGKATPCDPSLGSSFFVSSHVDSTVSRVYTCPTGRIAAKIPVATRALSVQITPDAKLAISTSYDNEIAFIDTATNTVISRIQTSADVHPAGLDITPDGTRAYVTNLYDTGASVLVVDIASRSVIATIPMPAFYPNLVRVSPDGAMAAVSFQLGSDVYMIDTLTNTVTQHLSVAAPFGMTFNPTGTLLYIASARVGAGSVDVFNTSTWQRVSSIPVGAGPGTMTLTPDGNLLYVSNYDAGTISVIDVHRNKVIQTLNAGAKPLGPVFGR
jgi:YVTN family beta-propeller protein